MFNELISECRALPLEIAAQAEGIARYINEFCTGGWSKNSNGRYVSDPNFVTIKPQIARANNLAVTIRGNPHEFEKGEMIVVKGDQAGYSRFILDNPKQLADCLMHIDRARTLYDRGRTRSQSTPTTIG